MNIKLETEALLGRNLTSKEVSNFRFYWTKIFMNPHDIAAMIEK